MDPLLNMIIMNDRLTGVFGVVNMYRVIRELLKLAPQRHERVLLNIPIQRDHDVTVVVSGKTAVKIVPDCETFFQMYGNSFEEVEVR